MEISEIIAINLKKLREERHLSLGQLADMAGVSKVMLSQLEKGSSNPTINTIWKITGALHLPYTALLEQPEIKTEHIQKAAITPLEEEKYHIFSYYSKSAGSSMEVYQIEMDEGCVHQSIGHTANSCEYIMLVEGEMTVEVDGERFDLKKDDGFRFDASFPHTYINNGSIKNKAVLMIDYKE